MLRTWTSEQFESYLPTLKYNVKNLDFGAVGTPPTNLNMKNFGAVGALPTHLKMHLTAGYDCCV